MCPIAAFTQEPTRKLPTEIAYGCIARVHCNSHEDPINCIRTINSVISNFKIIMIL